MFEDFKDREEVLQNSKSVSVLLSNADNDGEAGSAKARGFLSLKI